MTVVERGNDGWVRDAACRCSDRLVVSPQESVDHRRSRERAAKQVCGDCSVRRACLDFALRVHEPLGIWGGLNEVERRALHG